MSGSSLTRDEKLDRKCEPSAAQAVVCFVIGVTSRRAAGGESTGVPGAEFVCQRERAVAGITRLAIKVVSAPIAATTKLADRKRLSSVLRISKVFL
jgi:hypothetical protein